MTHVVFVCAADRVATAYLRPLLFDRSEEGIDYEGEYCPIRRADSGSGGIGLHTSWCSELVD